MSGVEPGARAETGDRALPAPLPVPGAGPAEAADTAAPALEWVVVVPVKGTDLSKSRLAELPATVAFRRRLALAFALDTVAAIAGASVVTQIVVVTSDPESGGALAGLATEAVPVSILPDPSAGLNAAVSAGISEARLRRPEAAIAAITADLPSLTSADVDATLAFAARHSAAFVADAEATGTTTITARPGALLVPHFGVDSAAAHAASGMIALPVAADSPIRHDVDTPADLAASASRFGAFTRGVLELPGGAETPLT